VALLRYAEQGFELAVPCPEAADPRPGLAAGFAAAHRALYGFELPGVPIEVVTLRLEVAGRLPAPTMPGPGEGDAAAASLGSQLLHLPGGSVAAPILARAALGAGSRIRGPAILTQLDATTLVPPGWVAGVLPTGALLLEPVVEPPG
jgi:N-methylhydantoinase A